MLSVVITMVFFGFFGAMAGLTGEINGKPFPKKWVIIIALVCALLGGAWKHNQNNSYYENDGCSGLGISRWC